jgi:hypothetical protein
MNALEELAQLDNMKNLIKNREGYLNSETHRECTNCQEIFEKTSAMTLCKPCNSSRVKSMTPEYKMMQRAKQRCVKSEREFNISIEDIIIPDICPILNIKLNMNSGKSGAYRNSPSLDRIDSSKGYTKDNIQVISQLANAMKSSANKLELLAFANWVLKTYGD